MKSSDHCYLADGRMGGGGGAGRDDGGKGEWKEDEVDFPERTTGKAIAE